MRRRHLQWALLIVMALLAAAVHGHVLSQAKAKLVGESWPEADRLFQRDPRWIGGDAVYSIDLGKGKVLWLFGDSFISTSKTRSRHQSTMVRNSVGIQTGYDVTSASLKFAYQEATGKPTSFFPAPSADEWYWPGHGAMVGKRLILFLWTEKAAGGLGFAATGWQAIAVENPSADPKDWVITKLQSESRFPVLMGAAVLVQGRYLYAYAGGRQRPEPTFLARWPLSACRGNTLGPPEWCVGTNQWLKEDDIHTEPATIANIGQSEFNIYPGLGKAPFLLILTQGFGAAALGYQTTQSLTSKYSGAKAFYLPPERSKPRVMIYSGKMHPMLTCPGYDVVASYSTNSFDFDKLLDDMTLYFPRFVRAKWVSDSSEQSGVTGSKHGSRR